MRRSLLLSLALPFTVLSTKAAAQTCVGMPAFTKSQSMQLSGGAQFADGANSFGGTFGYGAPKGLFGKAGIGTTSYDGPGGSSFDLNLGGGYQVPLQTKRTAELCPIANVSLGWGPNNVAGSGIDMSSRTFAFGAATGVILGRNPKLRFVPNASLQFANTRLSVDNGTTSVSGSESYGLLTLGTGFLFNSRFSLNPSINIPMGLDGGNTTFGVMAAYNFGS